MVAKANHHPLFKMSLFLTSKLVSRLNGCDLEYLGLWIKLLLSAEDGQGVLNVQSEAELAQVLNTPVELTVNCINLFEERGLCTISKQGIRINDYASYSMNTAIEVQRAKNRERVYKYRLAKRGITEGAKNIKSKTRYADKVNLTTEEYEKLVKQFGEVQTKEKIERLSLYKCSTGRTYSSDYFTILNWHRKDVSKVTQNGKKLEAL
jgi:hypothetical protein